MRRIHALLLVLLALGVILAARKWREPDHSHRTDIVPQDFHAFMVQEHLSGMVLASYTNDHLSSWWVVDLHDAQDAPPLSLQTRFPIASLSKPLTAATVRALIREKRLRLDNRLMDILPALPYAHDPGYAQITVQNLLQHTAGFDRLRSDDPLFADGQSAGCQQAIITAVSRPLDVPPNTHISYSNVGYCLLGRIIEQVSGEPYEHAVLHRLPALSQGASLGMPAAGTHTMPAPVGDWLSGIGPAGGWFADAAVLAEQFAQDAQDAAITLPPPAPYREHYYGLGWRVWPRHTGHRLTHFGSLPGIFTVAIAYPDGRAAVALFQGQPPDQESAFEKVLPLMENTLSMTVP